MIVKIWRQVLILFLQLCVSMVDLHAGSLDEALPRGVSPRDTIELRRLYDFVLQSKGTPTEWIYLDSLEEEALNQGDIKYRGLVCRDRVRYYYNQVNYDSAVYFAEQAIPFLKETAQNTIVIDIETMIINLQTWRGEYEFALARGREMFDEAERLADKEGMVLACESIGFAYVNSFRENQALEWYRKSLVLLDSMSGWGTYRMQVEILMVDCFFKINEIDSVKVHLDKLHVQLDDFEAGRDQLENGKVRIASYWVWLYAWLAEVAIREAQLDLASRYMAKAKTYLDQGVEDMTHEMFYFVYSNYYMATGEWDKALEAEEISQKHSQIPTRAIPEQYYRLGNIHNKRGDFQRALRLYEEGVSLSDSINSYLFNTQTSQLNSMYAVDRLLDEGEHERKEVGRLTLLVLSLFVVVLVLGGSIVLLVRYKRRLSIATGLAKEANLRTSDFLDDVSNKLRIALDEIMELSQSLIEESDAGKKKALSDTIRDRNGMLQHVIFNILDVSKIESGRMVFNCADVFLPDVMDEICGKAAREMPSGRSFRLLACPDVSMRVDLLRLRQIFDNLFLYVISNSNTGDIGLESYVEADRVCFNLSCDEAFLKEDEREILFDRRIQAGKTLEHMGLELVICKQLMVKMGGTLSVLDEDEEKTTFSFCLPLNGEPDKKGGKS